MIHDPTFQDAIAASLKAMRRTLAAANQRIDEACESIGKGEQNMAIGAVLGVDNLLTQASDLYKAVIAMHRFKA